MKNSRLIIFASLVLAGILLVQFNQMPNLDKQLGQARADLKQAKVNQVKSQTIVSSPKSRQETVSNSTSRVNKFVQTFSNQPTSSYPDSLKGLASQKVINELTQTFAPSVTFSDKAHYDVPLVGLKNAWGSDLEYLVIAKSDAQSVAYTITYDTDEKQVTDMSRLTLKGAFDNEK
ncbi:hypothetical protein PUV52_06980 [Leuconostoc mesenteroides]|uniref:Uncharacterized protein n=1 Tax=Leuconostoc mesenteroides subsp. mesenteroides (strain ATCC 8293 / DSM 20343 / BCRC 11652 / CCM 1803 / JCM 6124 / NCDO 523 / NBRC 100496 / NCIMB 8023 / NCTC 12954 / NRRL B-1118 / 37Y) TaxID=203120 RepID=Q03XD8_LEUMM|nr:hypothetical protein [Leuconostoc mesenteroides]ABJ62134.1 hypothetical protein LEUM_1034 [Leuconostoc mesenteroides subsp. mesenteroides ATCC 8293]MCT3043043.1 hypothetical protein [Leuconostoc mesenteroides]MDG9747153.1 hypothetical protein [Leuconostoc mesenteroides]QQB31064.1 hypothetical protein I6H90_09545 [Leuconostoc mesenteroides]STY37202.1 Uncharacterised protein [Leuconostoc mesenteroides]